MAISYDDIISNLSLPKCVNSYLTDNMTDSSRNEGLDLLGIGKLVKSIPPEVYTRSTKTALAMLEQLASPVTETTAGLGRYVKQKFDNMVDVEKARGSYAVEEAIRRAREKSQITGQIMQSPASPKTFVKAIEEASKESDPMLHEMWANLIASQLVEETCHPHFVEILSHFSPAEAKLLNSLLPLDKIGENDGGYIGISEGAFTHWMAQSGGDLSPWSVSCVLLLDFKFADMAPPKGSNLKQAAILYRTRLGSAFLSTVSTRSPNDALWNEFCLMRGAGKTQQHKPPKTWAFLFFPRQYEGAGRNNSR